MNRNKKLNKVKKIKKPGMSAIFGNELKEALTDIESFSNKKHNLNESVIEIPLSKIKPNPYQPRKIFKEEEISQLANSILTSGLISPINVVKDATGFILVAGERRLKAHQFNKAKTIKAIVVNYNQDKMQEMALIENIQRENLNGIEEAQAYQSLIVKHNLTQDDLSKKVFKSRTYVTNILRLLKLPKSVQKLILNSKLSIGHGKVLLSLENEQDILDFAIKTQKEKLSVRALESLVKKWKSKNIKKYKKHKSNDILYAEKLIREKLNTKVNIKNKNIVIKYTSVSDLNRIIQEMGALEK